MNHCCLGSAAYLESSCKKGPEKRSEEGFAADAIYCYLTMTYLMRLLGM